MNYKNRDWLYQQYWVEKKTLDEIADECGLCGNPAILYWMKRLKIERRSKSEARIGKKHKPHKPNCQCASCRNRRGEPHKSDCQCTSCINKRGEPHKSDCQCYSCKTKRGEAHKPNCRCVICKYKEGNYKGKNHHHWRGNNISNSGFRSRGRKIWQQHFGPIPKGAVIHHIDGNPKNNEVDNLMLLPSQGAHIKLHRQLEQNGVQ